MIKKNLTKTWKAITQIDQFTKRILILGLIMAGASAWVVFNLYNVMIKDHGKYLKQRDALTVRTVKTQARRGRILDGNELNQPAILAMSEHAYELRALPRILLKGMEKGSPEREATVIKAANEIEAIIGDKAISRKTLIRRLSADKYEIPLVKTVNFKQAKLLQELGYLRLVLSIRRKYPKKTLAANILGFTNSNGAVSGIEKAYDSYLAGVDGIKSLTVSSRGLRLANQDSATITEVKNGASVQLTILEPIQAIVEKEMRKMVEKFPCKSAAIMMIKPSTGDILAMAQYPTFDPNDTKDRNPFNYRNRLLEDVFEPGSTMKPISLAGVIEYSHGRVDLNTKVWCEKGLWYFGGRTLRDSGHRYEDLSLAEVIQKSSNIGTAKFSQLIGDQLMHFNFKRFNFGKKSGLNLGVESRGILRDWKKWDKLSITRLPMGQGIGVTIPQMVQAYGAIANDGVMMEPRLVKKILSDETEIEFPPTQKRRVIKSATADKISQAMMLVTQEGGTAKRAAIEGYHVAGKTGTAQKWIPRTINADGSISKGHYSHRKYTASFIGFVPATRPEFVLMVLVDEPPSKTHYGGTVAAPTWKGIASETLSYLNVAPDKEIEK